jgi:FADH2 O2-dependent halogenase
VADFDLAIVGSGFGGSVLAMIARRLGLRVVLIERGRHPRFAIGESASPLAGVLIEQLADRYDLPRLRPLSAYGTWRRTYPRVACGLKRGFTYFRHEDGKRYRTADHRSNQLLVAASPNDELSDTHWLRSDVDAFLVEEAIAHGADYVDETALEACAWRPGGSALLTGTRHARRLRMSARLVVDASGPRGFLSGALGVGNRGFDEYPATQSLFSHFTRVARCDEMPDYASSHGGGAVLAGDASATAAGPPYPVDDAALHHVFDGGWMWVLRFENGVTSAGIAVTDALATDLRLADGAPAWRRFLDRYPSIGAQFADAEPIREFAWMPRLSWRAEAAAGDGWAMLPSAAAFVDPLFSTGIPLTLLGIERLARVLEKDASNAEPSGVGDRVLGGAPWRAYSDVTLAEAGHTAAFVAGCYAAFPRFEDFTSYSMFYFAAASFSEMARRFGVSRANRFLCADDPQFGAATIRLSPSRTRLRGREYRDAVFAAVEGLNVAGLCEPSKRNWYGVDLEDTVRAAARLGLEAGRIRAELTALQACPGR